jgi:hypothetical protein
MKRKRNNFLAQLQRRRDQAASPPQRSSTTPPIEEMSDEKLDEALTAAKRQLLDAQHAELRERELARVAKQGQGTQEGEGTWSLADVLREKQRAKRRTWR